MFPGLQMNPLDIEADANLSTEVRTATPCLEAASAPMHIPLITRENGDALMAAPDTEITMNDAVTVLKVKVKFVE